MRNLAKFSKSVRFEIEIQWIPSGMFKMTTGALKYKCAIHYMYLRTWYKPALWTRIQCCVAIYRGVLRFKACSIVWPIRLENKGHTVVQGVDLLGHCQIWTRTKFTDGCAAASKQKDRFKVQSAFLWSGITTISWMDSD